MPCHSLVNTDNTSVATSALARNATAGASGRDPNARTLAFLCTATFLIFFQAFMVAPLIPRLADDLDATAQRIGLIVPAYMLAYGMATLLYATDWRPTAGAGVGSCSDRS